MRASAPDTSWQTVADDLRRRGLRWTPQRRLVLDAISEARGHITGVEIVERCRRRDPAVVPSTVYRTLDVLEGLGVVRHAHGPDGREEYHVRPDAEHAHLHCEACGGRWELDTLEVRPLIATLRRDRGFDVDPSHLTVVGRCADCATGPEMGARATARGLRK